VVRPRQLIPSPVPRRPRGSGGPEPRTRRLAAWVPAFAGMTRTRAGIICLNSTTSYSAKMLDAGGTNWQNPAFDQRRGSIFVPATESSSVFTKSPPDRAIDVGQNGFYVGSG
jgi:hypothetical protein